MDTPEYPPNSKRGPKNEKKAEKKIEPVVTGGAKRRRRSLRKQFSETFVAGDARTAFNFVMFDVLLPAARDMVWEAGSEGLRAWMFGRDGRRRGGSAPSAGPLGVVNYNRYALGNQGSPQRSISQQARARHNFDEIVLDQRGEAEDVIDRMFDLVSQYELATVADLYDLVGLRSSHTDHKWGWADLAGASVSRVRNGYLLNLPEPQPLQ